MAHKNTVLLVDDDEFGLDILKMVLANEGYQLVFATNGFEAIERASEYLPDVILLDVMMPLMDGYEVCQRLRNDPNLAEVPIIMLTALDDRTSRLKGIEAGADDFITKPYDQIELRTRVNTIIKLNRYRQLMVERSKFDWVVENAADGYAIIDQEGMIHYANRQARTYLGLGESDNQVIEETFLELVQKTYRCEPEMAWKDWPRTTNKLFKRYLVMPESDMSSVLWLQVDTLNVTPITVGQRLVHIHDVTAEVVEQRLSWVFHSQIDHKLRTPLGIFTAYLELLAQQAHEFDNSYKDLILGANQSAKILQNHLLNIFSYLDGFGLAKDGPNCHVSDLPRLVRKIRAELEISHVKIDYQACEDTAFLPLSPDAMELILYELLTNAKKFHPEQKPKIEVVISCEEKKLKLTVADDGQHLAPDQLVNMWQPYYQAEKYFSGQVPGIGLGLAKIAGLCWEVDSTYRAYNREDNKGIVVEIQLPFIQL